MRLYNLSITVNQRLLHDDAREQSELKQDKNVYLVEQFNIYPITHLLINL